MEHYTFSKMRPWAAAVMIAASTLTVQSASAQQVIPFLGCPLGCGAPETDTVLAARMARDGAQFLPAAQETPGFMYNVRVMAEPNRWQNTVFGTEDTVIQAAFQGGSEGLERFVPEPIPIKFQLLYGQGFAAQGKFFVTFDPSISSVEDMKGKRVSIGLPTQSDWGMAASHFLEYGYGITDENTDIRYVTPAVMTQQLIDGTTDVALAAMLTNADQDVFWTNNLTHQLQASGRTLRYISLSEQAVNAVNEQLGKTYGHITVPAGTMPGQTEDFTTGTNRIFAAVHPDFPEEIAYELVMAVHKHGPSLREGRQGFWLFWSESNMLAGLSEENAHPGAIRAYKELGIWELAQNYPPMTYPTSD